MCIALGTGAALAIAGSGVAAGVGTAIAGSEAAGATKSAANTAASEQQSALQQQEALAAPYTALGQSAIPQLQTLLGLGSGGSAGAQSALAATPGYQFTLNQGLQGVNNSASAQGMLLSGNTLQALDQYGSGLADQTYQQAVGNLENTVNTGQAAAAGQAANIGNAATNLGNIAVNQGNTLAGIDTNTIAGLENSLGNTTNNLVLENTLASLGNSNLVSNANLYGGAASALVGSQVGYPAALDLG